MKIGGKICGERIFLRSYDKSDVAFAGGMWFDEENGRYLSDPTQEYIDDVFQKAFDGIENCADGFYFIICLNSGERIGSISTFPDENNSQYDIGYCIHKNFWKNGFGTEAVLLLMEWIKGRGGKIVTAEVACDNIASRKLLENLGFKVREKTSFKKYNMNISFDSFIYEKEL
ncbi:MAG: GNAT family N-acetyltransferase [Oscillospiraceae bacterium]|nr:GNAT family N-acetyltransferase [Oscillospiraceae bacterium]